MKCVRKVAGALAIALVVVLHYGELSAQTMQTHTYQIDSSNFANPERGFYHHTETSSSSFGYLNKATLETYRSEGISLILRVFYLEKFVSSDISDQYLAAMQQDFNTVRATGLKIIVRFAYTTKSTAPYGDATPEWVLKHISQLTPLLKQNADVIAVVQSGFVGAWGEGYYTDHFSQMLGSPNANDWNNRRAVVQALADAIPERLVQVRTPIMKMKLTNRTSPITAGEAYTNILPARLAFHNDCFLASADDYGTYTSNMDQEKIFLEQETVYQPIGGETCAIDVPLSECPNAVAQLKRFHWSFLNRDYNSAVLDTWENNCLSTVFNTLGYRFRIANSALQTITKPSGSISINVNVVNEGWANPYNTRDVEIVLKNKVTGKEYFYKTSEDPRRWALSDTVKINATVGLPKSMEEGDYAVYLNLPDPAASLHKNPAYSIRMANTDMWDAAAGYNNLNHTLTVSRSAGTATYTGGNYFSSIPSVPPFIKSFITDGSSVEWKGVESIVSADQPGIKAIKVYNTTDSIYFLLSGVALTKTFRLFVDADKSATTGFNVNSWVDNGADYKIEDGTFSKYVGAGNWTVVANTMMSRNDSLIELAMPLSLLATGVPFDTEFDLAVVHDPGGAAQSFLPELGASFVPYRLLLNLPAKPGVTSSGNKAIIYWESNATNGNYTVLDRSIGGAAFLPIAVVQPGTIYYVDDNLTTATDYSYRVHYQGADLLSVSAQSDTSMVDTHAKPDYYTFNADGDAGEWENVIPIATVGHRNNLIAFRVFASNDKLNALFEGETIKSYHIYLDVDNNGLTGRAGDVGSYAGFDYMISNDSLFVNNSGAWKFASLATHGIAGVFNEVSIPTSQLSLLANSTLINTQATIVVSDDATIYLPDQLSSPLQVVRTLPGVAPTIKVINSETMPASQLIVQWTSCASCNGFVLERSVGDSLHFAVAAKRNKYTYAYYDNNLAVGVTVYYRLFSYNESGPSFYSAIKYNVPHVMTGFDQDPANLVQLYPNPTSGILQVKSETPTTMDVEFRDVQGRLMSVPPGVISGKSIQFDLSSLSRGIYIICVHTSSFIRFGKLLKE